MFLLVHLAACGRVQFASRPDAATDTLDIDMVDIDAPDAAPPRCAATAPFTGIAPIAALNSTAIDGGVRLSDDELTVVFHSTRGGPFAIWIASRADRTLPFGLPQQLFAGNTFWPTLSTDGLSLVYGDGGDLLLSTRASTADTFVAGTALAGTMTADGEGTPSFGRSGTTLYFARFIPDGTIFVAPWPSLGSAQPLISIDTAVDESAPALSADELTIYFSRSTDIYTAQRSDAQSAFGAAQVVAELATASNEGAGWLSEDQCRLYFESDRSGDFDLYLAERLP